MESEINAVSFMWVQLEHKHVHWGILGSDLDWIAV